MTTTHNIATETAAAKHNAFTAGGFYWTWLYQRSNSIWGPWIGHGIVDVAIFTVGYLICFA